jgi:transcription elongation factor Elf1
MVDTGEMKMNDEYKRLVRVWECPSCGNKTGVYTAKKAKDER